MPTGLQPAAPPKRLRTRAEMLLVKTPRDVVALPLQDVQKLVHELQVHQIELDMQNDELHRTQLQLEAARARLLLPYDAAPVGFLTLDAPGVIREANLAAARLLELDRVKLLGRKLTHFIAPESQDAFYLHCRRLFSTEEKQTCELRLLRAGGGQWTAQLEAVVDRTDGGPPQRCLVVLSDITERKRTEEALRQSEARFRALTTASADVLYRMNPDWSVLLQLDGRGFIADTAQPSSNWLQAYIPREDQPRVLAAIQAARRTRGIFELEHRVVRVDGTLGWMFSRAVPLLEANGEIADWFGAATDITARKQAEQALHEAQAELEQRVRERTKQLKWANEALRGEKAFSDSLIEIAPAVIAVMDTQGNLIRTNAYAQQLAGYPFAETQGRNMIEMFVPKEAQPRVGQLLQAALGGRAAQAVVAPLRTRDGQIRQIEWYSKPILNAAGEQTVVLAIGQDITDRRQLEQEILEISEREHRRIAQDLHDGLGQLLAGAAYLAGTARQDLAAKARPEAPQLHRIWEVINEALALTRNLARGLHPVEAEPNGLMVALEALAARTTKLFHIRCHFSCCRPVLLKDNVVATHLFRIAQEAVTNAIKHGQPGHIQIRLTPTREGIKLAVQDNGSGLPARQRQPAGLGLRIMRYRADIIGGSLAIRTGAGGGTVIDCTLNLAAPSDGQRDPRTVPQRNSRKE